MSEIVQKATTELIVDGEQARKELDLINDKILELNKQIKTARKDGDTDLEKSLKKQRTLLVQNRKELKSDIIEVNKTLNSLSAAKPKELNAAIRSLTKQLNSPAVKRGSKEWEEYTNKIKRCKDELSRVNSELQLGESRLSRYTDTFNKYAAVTASFVGTITGVGFTVKKAVDEFGELSDAYAGVMKYTGMTRAQVEDLNVSFQQMDTRTSRIRLNELAMDAGRLGLQTKEAILEFVEAANIINVALGEDLGDDAVKNIGKLSDMFGISAEKGLKNGMLATASAINELAQNSSAAEPYLLQFTARLAGTSKQAKIAMTDIMGYASALDQDMMQVEMSSTALQKVLMKMYQDPAKFAKIAGRDVSEFTRLLKEDANEAFLQFLDTLGKKGGMDQLAPIFKELKLDGARAASVMSDLATNVDRIRREQKLANEAFSEGTSVINEYNTVNNNEAALLEKRKKRFKDLIYQLGEQMLPHYNKLIIGTGTMITLLIELPAWLKKNWEWLAALVVVIGSYNAKLIKHTTLKYADIAADKLKVIWTEKILVSVQRLYRTLLTSPWAALASVIAIATVAIYKFVTRINEAEQAVKDFRKELGKEQLEALQLFEALKKANEGTETRSKLIKTINDKYGEFLSNQLTEKSNWEEIDAALRDVNLSLENQIGIRMKNDASSNIIEKYMNKVSKGYEFIRKNATKFSESDVVTNLFMAELRDMVQKGEKNAWEISAELKKYGNILTSGSFRELQAILKMTEDYRQDMSDLENKFSFLNSVPSAGTSGAGGDSDPDGTNGQIEAKKSLLEIQEELKAQAKEMPETTEEEIRAKNKLIKTIDDEINRLKNLGVEKEDKKAVKKKKKDQDDELKDNDNFYNQLKNQVRTQYLNQEINQTIYNRRLELLNIQSLSNRIEILKKYGKDVSKEEAQILDKRIEMAKKAKEAGKLSAYLGVKQDPEKEDPELEKLMARTQKSYSFKQALLQHQYEQGLLTQKEYQKKERELLAEHLQEMLEDKMEFAEMAAQIANQAANLVDALCRREELAVENKYAAELKAAKGNAEKTAALQEKIEEEKKEIKKKYADIDFAITAAQIIASTAASIMQLWVKPGFPAAIPLAVLVGATGIAQLALANEQRNQVKNLWTGGYTGSGRWDEPQGVVHSNEFVGNRFAVGNPAVNKVFRMVDVAQKNNTIARISETDIIRALGGNNAMATQVVYSSQSTGDSQMMTDTILYLSKNISELSQQMKEGTLARTYVTGAGGTKTTREKYDKMIKNVSRPVRV